MSPSLFVYSSSPLTISVYVPIYLSITLALSAHPINISVCLSINLSIPITKSNLCICLIIYPSLSRAHLSIFLSLYLPISLALPTHPSTYLPPIYKSPTCPHSQCHCSPSAANITATSRQYPCCCCHHRSHITARVNIKLSSVTLFTVNGLKQKLRPITNCCQTCVSHFAI